MMHKKLLIQAMTTPKRRQLLVAIGFGVAAPYCFAIPQVLDWDFTVLPLVSRNFPISTIATCEDLEKTIALFNAELARLNSNFTGVGQEIFERVRSRRAELQASIIQGKNFEQDAKIDEAFAQINLGLSLIFLAVGCFLATPVAIGIAAGTSVLVGTSVFAFQAYYKKNTTDPAFIGGYARDRALMFTELGSADAASSAGRFLSTGVKATNILLSTYEVYKANSEIDTAREGIRAVLKSLDILDSNITKFGKNTATWANIYQKHLLAARDSLQNFIAATRKNQCQLEKIIIKKP